MGHKPAITDSESGGLKERTRQTTALEFNDTVFALEFISVK